MIIKALSLIQPYASLIMDVDPATGLPRKQVETRSWNTNYMGPLAIHASLTKGGSYHDACNKFGYDYSTIPRGVILGTVTLVMCAPFPNVLMPPDEYGDYTLGRWGWLLKDPVKFAKPIHILGGRSLWNWEMPEAVA